MALTTSGVLRAQTAGRSVRIGHLGPPVDHEKDARELFERLHAAMRQVGWADGEQVYYEVRFPLGIDTNRTPEAIAKMAQELATTKPDVLITMSTPCALAAKAATATVPIVFLAEDPVKYGLVETLAHPGGNLTGVSYHIELLLGKRMQLLKQTVPTLRHVGYLGIRGGATTFEAFQLAQSAAQSLGLSVSLGEVESAEDLERTIAAPHVEAWIVDNYALFESQSERIISLMAKLRKPAMYAQADWAREGGLIAYADDRSDWPRRVAALADRILRGAKPAQLPVDQPTRFVLALNLKTAREMGITIPQSVVLSADEVIE